MVKVLSVGQSTINKAMRSGFKDFEDALQNYCAEEANLHTPKEYLAMIGE